MTTGSQTAATAATGSAAGAADELRVRLTDSTLRDGSHALAHQFTEEQVRAYGGPKFQVAQQVMERFAEAIETSHVDVVPKIVVGGAGGGAGGAGGSSLLEALLAIVLSDKLGGDATTRAGTDVPLEVQELRSGIRNSLMANLKKNGG